MRGRMGISVEQFAETCGVSVRSLEERLARELGLSPKRLLMWSLALHSAWHVDHLGKLPKQAAAAAGFRSTQGLSNRVQRVTGLRLADFYRRGGFGDLLERFASVLESGRSEA